LRRKLGAQNPEAIFTSSGEVVHAEGAARSKDARATLRQAVVAQETARGKLRKKDSVAALNLWRGLVEGRWSLLDHFDSDGKRFVVARRNAPELIDPRALSMREREVVSLAAMGHSNKQIGYALGLPLSTVATHLTSAQKKLRVANRAELARFHAVTSSAAQRVDLTVGSEEVSALVLPSLRNELSASGLTRSEEVVAAAVCRGESNEQIARTRGTSARTVANQLASIFRKVGVRSRSELIARISGRRLPTN
jgi:DNA-binding NarL/FixJ family response regulator